MAIFACLFPWSKYGQVPDLESCQFCRVSADNGFEIIWEDETFIAFCDRDPATAVHFQVVPRTHIRSVADLRSCDVDLVKAMEKIGHALLDNHGVPPLNHKLGFHIPPYNSVYHLHMHVQGLPYKSLFRRLKYPVAHGSRSHTKGFSWFVTAEQTVQILKREGRIGLFPS